MTDVTIVDLGLGNLRSVGRAFERAGFSSVRTEDPTVVRRANRVVVPGQGAFGDGAAAIRSPLGDAVRSHVEAGRPYLGICLGMQLLFGESDESPGDVGFGLLPGRVGRLKAPADEASADEASAHEASAHEEGPRLKVPHMGWNQVRSEHPFVTDGDWFYFVHSYVCEPADEQHVAGTTEYGRPLCSAVSRGSLFACQFHPEKSQGAGLRLLQRFVEARR